MPAPHPLLLDVTAYTGLVALTLGASYVLGYRLGKAGRPVRVVDIDGLRQRWAAEAAVSTPVETARVSETPVLVRRSEGSYARFRWDMLSRRQWGALLETTATNELSGDGKPFSRSMLEAVRDLLIARGCAAWRDPEHRNKGWEVNPSMCRAIAHHLGMALPHRPPALPVGRANSQVHTYMHTPEKGKVREK